MEPVANTHSLHSDLSERTLTLNLIIKDPVTVSVRSFEVLGRGFRNRISFQDLSTLDDILVSRLAVAIHSCLRSLPDGAHVLSLPDFLVELPGLALSGAHVMVMKSTDGARNAIFRFKEFLGSINNAFRPQIGFHEPYSTHSEKLAINVLEEICLPILNLCRSFDALSFGQDRSAGLEIEHRAREFEFQTELLKRFIFNAGIGHVEASEVHLDRDGPQAPLPLAD